MHETLKTMLLEALTACTPAVSLEDEDASPRLDPCADENEYASRVAEVGIALSLRRRMRERRLEIEGALKRLDAGSYGTCDECGDDIGLARLMASPAATLCVHCQADRERGPRLRCA
jgi:DnaK suppressor protein